MKAVSVLVLASALLLLGVSAASFAEDEWHCAFSGLWYIY